MLYCISAMIFQIIIQLIWIGLVRGIIELAKILNQHSIAGKITSKSRNGMIYQIIRITIVRFITPPRIILVEKWNPDHIIR